MICVTIDYLLNVRVAWIAFILAASCLSAQVASQTPSGCSATLTLNSTYPGHAFYLYYDIIVQNVGPCALTKVFVVVTLPPDTTPFAYYNISNQTGELYGLTFPMTQGSIQNGGTVVLNSARVPVVSVGGLECSAACANVETPSTSPSASLDTIKVETKRGSNPWWFAVAIIYDGTATSEVQLRNATSTSWQQMKRENWDGTPTYTYSTPTNGLELPISLQLTSVNGETIILDDIATSFSYSILDTSKKYERTSTRSISHPSISVEPLIEDTIQLFVHPASNIHWIGLIPYNARTSIAAISIKAQNSDWVALLSPSGIFEIFIIDFTLQLPISIKLTSSEKMVFVLENIITSLDGQFIKTAVQF